MRQHHVVTTCVVCLQTMTISFAVCVSFAGTGPPCPLRERYNVGPPQDCLTLTSEAGMHAPLAHAVVNRIDS